MRWLQNVIALACAECAGLYGANLRAQTLTVHRIPAVLAPEAAGEAVTACAKQGYKVSATVIDPEGVRIATLRGDGAGVHTTTPPMRRPLLLYRLPRPSLVSIQVGNLANFLPSSQTSSRRPGCCSGRVGS